MAVTGCKLQVTSYKLQVTSYRLCTSGISRYRFEVQPEICNLKPETSYINH